MSKMTTFKNTNSRKKKSKFYILGGHPKYRISNADLKRLAEFYTWKLKKNISFFSQLTYYSPAKNLQKVVRTSKMVLYFQMYVAFT